MTGLHHELDFVEVRAFMVREARAMTPELVNRITAQIQQSVASYAGPTTGRRHRLIEMASSAAISHFLDSVEHPQPASRSVDELFRRMGHGEATEGHDLDAMRAALRIVNLEAWDLFRTFGREQGWTAAVLGSICDALFAYTEHLSRQAQLGYEGAVRALEQDPGRARTGLVDGLLDGADIADLRPLATKARWLLPDLFAVVSVAPSDTEPLADLTDLPDRFLVRADPVSAIVVARPDDRAELFELIHGRGATLRIATSWPVPRENVPDAWRWVTRAHELVTRGVIADAPVIYCGEHRTELWLHAEPGLRQRLCQELLRPLLAETPNSREILSETLLAWLESRDSAPAIASRLGVHPQTVRYRWKRINELFGDDLREPEFVVQITMLLKASVPLWKAGDQSDFERFRTEDFE